MYGGPPAHDTQRTDGSWLLCPVMGEEWASRSPRAAGLAVLPGRDPWRPRGPPAAWHPPPSALSGCSSGITAPFVTRCGSTGPRFILKGNVAGGGGKRKKLSRFSRSLDSRPPSSLQEPGRPAAIVSPGAWPPGRHGQLLACTRCRAWAVGTRPSLLPFLSLDSISFIHETFPKSLLCARLVILARPSRSAQSPRARRLWAVGMWRAGRASRRRRFCTPVWRGGGWRRGGGRTGCWGPLESHERDTGLQPGAGHKPAGWALGQRPALRRPAPGWARQWTPSCGREEGVWEMLDASRAGRAVWVWWEGELRMTGQGSSCRDTPQEF